MNQPADSRPILVVDDDPDTCEILTLALNKEGFAVTSGTQPLKALDLLQTDRFDAVLTDLRMEGMNGLDLCERIVACRPDVPVLVLTGNGNLETAVAAIRAGAYDFICKPPDSSVLGLALARAVQHRLLRSEIKRLRSALPGVGAFGELQGTSAPMRSLYALLGRSANTEASILIVGESGTGKELCAQGLHAASSRRDSPFVALNCSALPEALLESELFGHRRGAFTGASADREGLLVSARGGTVLLDEIGDMPLALQPKLLRALQERAVRPVGSDHEVPFRARLIAATHHDLRAAVEAGRFREDLYFRLNVIQVDMPPLRARGLDILLLAQGFVQHFAESTSRAVTGFTSAVAHRLLAYGWPGNVRELRNCIERAVALTQLSELVVEDLPSHLQSFAGFDLPASAASPQTLLPLETVERQHVERVLSSVDGNKREAARILGLDRKTLYRKIDKWNQGSGVEEPLRSIEKQTSR